jgi:hypothetical protein
MRAPGCRPQTRPSCVASKGTYGSVAPFHLGKYLDEEVFRFNERKDLTAGA